MPQVIKKISLAQPPAKVCTDVQNLNLEMQKFQGMQICIFIGEYNGVSWLMFDGNGALAPDNAVAFEAPCPPFCTENEDLYAIV